VDKVACRRGCPALTGKLSGAVKLSAAESGGMLSSSVNAKVEKVEL
jgi:hypothetical protein